jgi:hypothetical protein
MAKVNFALWASLFVFWLASKLAYILSPFNPWHELQCWTLQFTDSWLASFGIFGVRPISNQCMDKLKDEFPQGTSWETQVQYVELTPENMSHFFATRKDALEVPWIIRGFLHQKGTTMDLTKYADIEYLLSHVNCTNEYNFDGVGKAERLPLCEAIHRMRQGDGLYMKFNRDFTNNENIFRTAVDDATEVLKRMGGPVVQHAIRDALKVTFFTYGEKMRTKIHNAMSANWFFQIAGMKDWKLYEPHQSIYLQPFNFPNAIASGSRYDTSSPNGPKPIKFRTYPGDFLFFPSFWLHEVDNVGDGSKLAIGLRPSVSGTIEMWKTAFIPFYESPPSTTGLALCHLGPSFKIVADNLYNRMRMKYATAVLGHSEEEARLSFEEYDRNRGRDWWIKSGYNNRKNVIGDNVVAMKQDEEKY